jgi:hypothetical protein
MKLFVLVLVATVALVTCALPSVDETLSERDGMALDAAAAPHVQGVLVSMSMTYDDPALSPMTTVFYDPYGEGNAVPATTPKCFRFDQTSHKYKPAH